MIWMEFSFINQISKYDLEFDLHNDGRIKYYKNTDILIEYFQLLNNAKKTKLEMWDYLVALIVV